MPSGAYNLTFNTGEPACAVDRNGKVMAWNPGAVATFGHQDSEALGRRCWQLLRGRDLFGNDYCCERCPQRDMAFRGKTVNRSRMYFRTASGELKLFTVSSLLLGEGPGTGLLVHLCHPEENTHLLARGETPPGTAGGKVGCGVLTPREHEVLENLAEGLSTQDIATVLKISVPTVRNHVEHVLRKLHAHTRLEAVAVARRLGLL